MAPTYQKVLVIGAGGTIGQEVLNQAPTLGLEAVPTSRRKKQGWAYIGELQALQDAITNTDFVVLTHGGDGDPAAWEQTVTDVLNIAREQGKPISLMTAMNVTHELTGWYAQAHAAKFRSEERMRASGLHYVIVRPGWFGYQGAQEVRADLRQGDKVTGQRGLAPAHVAQALLHGIISTSGIHL